MKQILIFIKEKVKILTATFLVVLVSSATVSVVSAAIPDSGGAIHSCYRNQASVFNPKGSLRVINTGNGEACTNQETALSWNQSGSPQSTQQAYAHVIGVSDGSQVIPQLDSERSKNVTATFAQTPFGSGLCYQVSFEPKNVSATFINGNTTNAAVKSSSTGWSDGLTGGSTAEAVCADVQGANAFVAGNSNEYFVSFE